MMLSVLGNEKGFRRNEEGGVGLRKISQVPIRVLLTLDLEGRRDEPRLINLQNV